MSVSGMRLTCRDFLWWWSGKEGSRVLRAGTLEYIEDEGNIATLRCGNTVDLAKGFRLPNLIDVIADLYATRDEAVASAQQHLSSLTLLVGGHS